MATTAPTTPTTTRDLASAVSIHTPNSAPRATAINGLNGLVLPHIHTNPQNGATIGKASRANGVGGVNRGNAEETAVAVGNVSGKVLTGDYRALGRSGAIEASPAILHFAGFRLDQEHRLSFRVVNVSQTRTRVQILAPTDRQHFTIHGERKGDLAPGMGETITVHFVPTEYKYYYDCVRVHGVEANLIVPIHAYPTMNKAVFPKMIDFGASAINEEYVRTHKISCTVPIDFEFRFEMIDPNPYITIEPMDGIIPANQSVEIAVRYKPKSYETSLSSFRIHISQFSFQPFVCKVTGSCIPGFSREQLVEQAKQNYKSSIDTIDAADKQIPDTIEATVSSDPRIKMDSSKTTKKKGDGKKKLSSTKPQNQNETSSAYFVEHEGIRFPVHMDTQAGVTDILIQQPGKLRVKELKQAVHNKREKEEMQSKEQANLLNAMPDTLSVFEGEGSRQLKELAFEHEYQRRATFERSKEVRWFVCIGSNKMEPTEIEAVIQHRANTEKNIMENEKASDRARRVSELKANRVVHDRTIPPNHTPTYDAGLNILWHKRIKTLSRFLNAARIVVFRLRAQKRLGKIRILLQQAGFDKKQLAEIVQLESRHTNKVVSNEITRAKAKPPPLTTDMLLPIVFPIYREQNFMDSKTVSTNEVEDFVDFDYIPLRVPLQYEILGYKPPQISAISQYVKPEQNRALRYGADEEESVRGPRGTLPNLDLSLPNACLQFPSPLVFMNPHPHIRAYIESKKVMETSPDFKLQPTIKQFTSFLKGCGGDSLLALSQTPTLSEFWVPNRDDVLDVPLSNADVRLLNGPEVDDNMSDSDEDDTPLPITLSKPSHEWIRSQYELLSEQQVQDFRTKKLDQFVLKTSAKRPYDENPVIQPPFAINVRNSFDTVNTVIFNPLYRLKDS